MSRNSVIDDATLLEYLGGALDANARAAVDAALAESPALSEQLESLRVLMPMVRAALDEATVPVPPVPSWAAIRERAGEHPTPCPSLPCTLDIPVSMMVRTSKVGLLLAGALALVIINLMTFFLASPALFLVVGMMTLLALRLLPAFDTHAGWYTRPSVIDAPQAAPWFSPHDSPAGGGHRRVTVLSKVGGGISISTQVSTGQIQRVIASARILALAFQSLAMLHQLGRLLGFW